MGIRFATLFGLVLFGGFASGSEAKLESKVSELCSRYNDRLSGALWVRHGEDATDCSFGWADIETQRPNGVDEVYLIASTSKQITATAMLKLEEQDPAFDIDQPLASFFPEIDAVHFRWDQEQVSVRHLLNHTSGLPSVYNSAELREVAFQREISMEEILGYMVAEFEAQRAKSGKSLVYQPGTHFNYSNTGYLLLGEILRRRTDASYSAFAERHLFQPTLLRSTTIGPPASGDYVTAYDRVDGELVEFMEAHSYKVRHDGDIFTDGNVYTTLRELDQWVRGLAHGKVLSAESWRKMSAPGLNNYGLGWFIIGEGDEQYIEHGGYWIGYSTFFRYYPNRRVTVGFYSNVPLDRELEKEFIGQVIEVAHE